ncbi:MAG: type II toxin-antitoxin system VapC family toxin [bacterium]|nr:type II toxin-antitoxin system VapC family toxin [bacterium]
MDKIILDTSVIIKWFVKEENSDKADGWLVKIKNSSVLLVSPAVLFLELSNALILGNKYEKQDAKRAVAAVYKLSPEIIYPDQNLIEDIIELMAKDKIAAYDALFIVLSQKFNIPLLTADLKHHKKEYSPNIQYLL